MLGSLKIRRQKSLAPAFRAPVDDVQTPRGPRDLDDRPEAAVDLRDEEGERRGPRPRNMSAWSTLVQTIAFTPPVAM